MFVRFPQAEEEIDGDGVCSFGTPVFADLQGYKDVALTSMPYGSAMAMLMLGEYARRFL